MRELNNFDLTNHLTSGKLIDNILTDYDVHLLPEAEGVNVTIELHVQASLSQITVINISYCIL